MENIEIFTTKKLYHHCNLPEGIESIEREENDGLFITKETERLTKEFGEQFLRNQPPVRENDLSCDVYVQRGNELAFYAYLEKEQNDFFKLIHSMCREKGEIIAFRRAYLQRELRKIYDRYKQEGKDFDEQQNSVEKYLKENTILRTLGNLFKKINDILLFDWDAAKTKNEPPTSNLQLPKMPHLAVSECTAGILRHSPLNELLKIFVQTGYLEKTYGSEKNGPTDYPGNGSLFEIFEPTQKMMKLAISQSNRNAFDWRTLV